MRCSFGTFVILTALFTSFLCRAENEGEYSISDESPAIRVKRVYIGHVYRIGAKLSKVGNQAFTKLSIGAKQILDETKYRVYEKVGDFDTAVEDFRSVGAETKTKSKAGRAGEVGNRVIEVKRSGYKSYPTLYLIKKPRAPTSRPHTDVFVYKPKILHF